MKQTLLLTAFSVLSGSAFAATSYNFDSNVVDDLFSGDVAGFTQNVNNPFFGGEELGLAYIDANPTGGSPAGFLGTTWTNFGTGSVIVTGDISDAGTLSGQQITVDMSLVSSGTVRDSFGINVTGASSTVASVFFTPGATSTSWNVSYAVGGGASESTLVTINTDTSYSFFVQFLDGSITFGYGSGGVSTPFAIALTGAAAGEDFEGIQFVHTPNPDEAVGFSTNAIVFDNIAVGAIPEPTSAMLMGVAALGLLRRRRA